MASKPIDPHQAPINIHCQSNKRNIERRANTAKDILTSSSPRMLAGRNSPGGWINIMLFQQNGVIMRMCPEAVSWWHPPGTGNCEIFDIFSFWPVFHLRLSREHQVPKACVSKKASPQWPVLLSAFLLILAFLFGLTWWVGLLVTNGLKYVRRPGGLGEGGG